MFEDTIQVLEALQKYCTECIKSCEVTAEALSDIQMKSFTLGSKSAFESTLDLINIVLKQRKGE